jgi:hypothetical protein
VWGRPGGAIEWHLDFKIEAVEGDEWVYRRDPKVRKPLAKLGVVVDGIPYLAPEIAQLYATGSA